MGEKSEYYQNLKARKKQKLHQLEKQLPVYMLPYLDEKELNAQINTVISYVYDLIVFLKFLIETNPRLKDQKTDKVPLEILSQLCFEDINDYQKYLSYNDGENPHLCDERAIAQRMAPVRGFFQFAFFHDYIDHNPTLGMAPRQKTREHEIIRLTSDEVHTLLSKIDHNGENVSERQKKYCQKTQFRDTAIIILLLYTGIRVSECVGLDLNDFNFKEHSFSIVRKGGSASTLYFNVEVESALKDYIHYERPQYAEPDEKALFLSIQKQRISVRAVQVMVKKFSSIAIPNKKITPHKMRSTFGTALYKKTGDIRLVADTLGHKDVNTTSKHYAATDDENRRIASNIDLY